MAVFGGGWGWPMHELEAAAPPGQDPPVPHSVQLSSATSLAEWLGPLWRNSECSDVTICSEDSTVVVPCHKLVLGRWSAPLRRMLTGDMREARDSRVTLHGVEGIVLESFLQFLYTCSCAIPTEKLVGLAAVADQYDVTALQQLCLDAIRSHSSASQRCCALFYQAAKAVQQLDIQQLAWEQLTANLNSLVRQHDVFVALELEDVLRLCRRPSSTAGGGGGASSSSGGANPADGRSGGGGGFPAAGAFGLPHGTTFARADAGLAEWPSQPAPRRPEYQVFLALMAWLQHTPERQAHRRAVLDCCCDMDAMSGRELSQMRFSEHVQGDDGLLKEMLMDAMARRLAKAGSQGPTYHMPPF